MKFPANYEIKRKFIQILIISIILSTTYVYALSSRYKGPKSHPDPPINPSDSVYKRIKYNIYNMAEDFMKSTNLMSKKKISGVLPEGFPDELVKKALETRNDIKKWRHMMALPTAIYRMCLYPFAKVNYVKWCNNNFFGAKNKGDSCRYSFCQVCCDNLVFVYQNAAEKNLIGELLQLNQAQGIKAIRDVIDKTQIHNCKKDCRREYPVEMPEPLLNPPRDPQLGTEKRPALSCIDIKQWGAKSAKSGVYWIDMASKGPQQVFCDMETDNGGWTLFFNYIHQPGMELNLNENKLPNDLKTNSHMNLENAGFYSRDVKEIRFFCTERFKASKKFWHFKTTNKNIISVAMNGDQTALNRGDVLSGYVEIKAPANIQANYTPAVNKLQLPQFDIVGKDSKGGFTSTLFGSSSYEMNWTVKGNDPLQDIFECGSTHRLEDFTPADDNPSMIFTHHSVWFRGNAPTPEEARDRYMENLSKPLYSG